jgi:DNA repair exonuclease SbcCD ATPase subunit
VEVIEHTAAWAKHVEALTLQQPSGAPADADTSKELLALQKAYDELVRDLERVRAEADQQAETLRRVLPSGPQDTQEEVQTLRKALLVADIDAQELRRQLLEYQTYLPQKATAARTADALGTGANALERGDVDRTELVGLLLKAQRVVHEAERREAECGRRWSALMVEAQSAQQALRDSRQEQDALRLQAREAERVAEGRVQRVLQELGNSLDGEKLRAAQILVEEASALREEKQRVEALAEESRKEVAKFKSRLKQEQNRRKLLEQLFTEREHAVDALEEAQRNGSLERVVELEDHVQRAELRLAASEEALRAARGQVERVLAQPEERVDDTVEVLSKVLRKKEDALVGLHTQYGKVDAERTALRKKEKALEAAVEERERKLGLLERRERALTAYVRSEALGSDRLQGAEPVAEPPPPLEPCVEPNIPQCPP